MAQILAMSGGMNWNWFARVELHEDGTATVLAEDRYHRTDYSQGAERENKLRKEADRNYYQMIENTEEYLANPREVSRKAVGIKINNVDHMFAEPVERWSFPRNV